MVSYVMSLTVTFNSTIIDWNVYILKHEAEIIANIIWYTSRNSMKELTLDKFLNIAVFSTILDVIRQARIR